MKQLSTVRGNQRVTSDNPEDTYNALKSTVRTLSRWQRRISLTL